MNVRLWCVRPLVKALLCGFVASFLFFSKSYAVDSAATTSALSTLAMGLPEIIRLALQNDPSMKVAELEERMSSARKIEARAGFLPSISLDGNYAHQQGEVAFGSAAAIDRKTYTKGWSVQLTQPLLRAANWADWQLADLRAEQIRLKSVYTRQSVLIKTTQAYFDVLAAQELVTLTLAQLDALNEQYALAQRSFEVGMSSVGEFYDAKAKKEGVHAALSAVRLDFLQKQANLARSIGQDAPQLKPFKNEITLPEIGFLEGWLAQVEQNLSVQISTLAVEIAKREVQKQRAAHYPSLDLTASYGQNYASGSFSSPADLETDARSGQIGVRLNIPLFSGGGVVARVDLALLEQEKAEIERQTAYKNARVEVLQAYQGIFNGQTRIQSLITALAAAKEGVLGTQKGFEVGTKIQADVLAAIGQQYSIEKDLALARYGLYTEWLRLWASVGQVDDLRVIDLARTLRD